LAKEPKDYTILEILLATEESMAIISTLDEGVNPDEVINQQTVGFWAGLQNYIHDYLRSVSLEDILNGTYAKLDNKFDHWDGSI
jgi:transcriptional regulator, badM/rrf2 family